MYQRHVPTGQGSEDGGGAAANSMPVPAATNGGNSTSSVPLATAPSSSGSKFRKRRKPKTQFHRRLFGNNNKPMNFLNDFMSDTPLLVSFLQLLSFIIVVGCVGTLLLRWFLSPTRTSIFSSLTDGVVDSGPPRKSNGIYPRVPLTPSRVYTIPDAMSHIGDKSDAYAILRREFDQKEDQLTMPKHKYNFDLIPMDPTKGPGNQEAYDIHNCPDTPPQGYPFTWKLIDMLKDWPADDPTPHPNVYQSFCVFDYQKDYDKALTYRNAELPFVIVNDPQVHRAVKRWNHPGYLDRMLGGIKHRTEKSENNHFLYWNRPHNKKKEKKNKPWVKEIDPPKEWKQPTEMLRTTYAEWLGHANVTDETLLGPDHPHWYYRLIGCGETGPEGQCDAGSSEYLFDEFTFFQPRESMYIVEPDNQKGIHCRFGMKGVIAENHFDGSRNFIALLGGERRYVLAHPDQCEYLSLYPKGHPSARHSEVDWSDPDLDTFPEFALAQGNEVVMQPGDVMYLPTNWFHYIISLSMNYQCNTRSGITREYMPPLHHCGF